MLKVAAGVFLGIIAVLVVIKLPDWIEEANNNHAEFVMLGLTQDNLIARCGKPIADKRSVEERRMTYEGRYGSVVMVFYRLSKTDWNLNHAEIAGMSVFMRTPKGGAARILGELPCMDKKD